MSVYLCVCSSCCRAKTKRQLSVQKYWNLSEFNKYLLFNTILRLNNSEPTSRIYYLIFFLYNICFTYKNEFNEAEIITLKNKASTSFTANATTCSPHTFFCNLVGINVYITTVSDKILALCTETYWDSSPR